jgi:signal transduction histidine kinase
MAKGRLMIVEDERFSATVLQRTVERLGYEVVGNVQNGHDAIEIFKKELPDVIIMDFNIQGDLDGGDLSLALAEIKRTSNIFITSAEDEESLQKIMDAKPDAYIQKPFEQRELRAVLELAFYKNKKENELNELLSSLDKKVKERTKELNETVRELVKEMAQREKVQRQLEESLNKEKKFGKLKSSIISNLSHEFKTPLSTIRSSAQFLTTLIERERFDKMNVKHSKRIEDAVDHLAELLTRILMVEENVNEVYNVVIEQVNVTEVLKATVSELKLGVCQGRTIDIDIQLDDGLIETDPRLFRLIISNIVSNACKYSQDEVLISVHREMDSLIMSFKDKGIGMSESDIEQIFYRFYRGENVGSIEGTGIGMSIMKRCLDALGGEVKINSELGKGSEFIVRLPINQE